MCFYQVADIGEHLFESFKTIAAIIGRFILYLELFLGLCFKWDLGFPLDGVEIVKAGGAVEELGVYGSFSKF